MYRVLIVDDEVLIRKRIILGFDWTSLGYQVSNEAESGAEALRILDENTIDIAIIDIAMPGMNGIELIKEIRRRKIPLEIILLTGYSEFKYAKEALSEGVFHYLLKPLDEEEFTAVLQRLFSKISEERKQSKQIDALIETENEAKRILCSQYFSRIFHSAYIYEQETDQMLEKYGLRADDWFAMVILRRDEDLLIEDPFRQRLGPLEKLLHRFSPLTYGDVIITYDLYENLPMMIVRLCKQENDQHFTQGIKGIESFCHLILSNYHDYSIGLSDANQGYDGLRSAYDQAAEALGNAGMIDKPFVRWNELENQFANTYRLSDAEEKEFLFCVESGNAKQAAAYIGRHLSAAIQACVIFSEYRKLCQRFVGILDDALHTENLELKEFLGDYESVYTMFLFLHQADRIRQWMEDLTRSVAESLETVRRKSKPLGIGNEARRYIQIHFREQGLSLTRIADDLGISGPYLSAIFKKAIGMSVTQYITMIRLNKAREMLLVGDRDIHTVAVQVGFNDEFYFSRCFKKYFGRSPSSIRRLNG